MNKVLMDTMWTPNQKHNELQIRLVLIDNRLSVFLFCIQWNLGIQHLRQNKKTTNLPEIILCKKKKDTAKMGFFKYVI